jgi:transcriptional regulator with XRE-family HTH domain
VTDVAGAAPGRKPRLLAAVLTPNQVASYRLREARRLRGWTQDQAAEHLAPYLGVRWSSATFSAAEGGAYAERRVREFCADELLAFARAFALPLWFFFLPPPAAGVAGPGEGLTPDAVLDAVFGSAEGWSDYEQRVLSEPAPQSGPRQPAEPWLLQRVRAAAQRGFGSPAAAADAVRRVRTLLDELDTPPTPSPKRHP